MDLHANVTLYTGTEMPVLGLGTWELNDDTAGAVAHALKLGYRMIDTSGDYGTQPGIAEGIKRSGVDRDNFFISTKVEETDNAYEAAKKNLRQLQLDYADLILIHRPPKQGAGEELWQGLIRAKKEGLALDIGVSNYDEERIETLVKDSGMVPVVNQVEWSPFGHSRQLLDYSKTRNIIIEAYSPLTRSERLDDYRLQAIAKHYQKTPAQVMIRWNLQLGVVPIIKANSYGHQQENLDVFDFVLSIEDMRALDALDEKYSALGKLAYV